MKIAIYGSAPSSILTGPTKDASFAKFTGGRAHLERHQFPFINEQWSVWACSPGTFGVLERIDRFFELHRWEPGQTWYSPEYCAYLRNFRGVLYTGEVIPELPNSVRLNREAIVGEFGQFFLTSSISIMMAWAIIEIELLRMQPRHDPGDDAIALHGVDMAATEEFATQRAGCHFFLMEAKRRGIAVYLPPESDLLRPRPIYGVCEWSHAHIKSLQRLRELEGRKNGCEAQIQNATQERFFLMGAIENQNYNMQTWLLNDASTVIGPDQSGRQLLYLRPEDEPVPVPLAEGPEPATWPEDLPVASTAPGRQTAYRWDGSPAYREPVPSTYPPSAYQAEPKEFP